MPRCEAVWIEPGDDIVGVTINNAGPTWDCLWVVWFKFGLNSFLIFSGKCPDYQDYKMQYPEGAEEDSSSDEESASDGKQKWIHLHKARIFWVHQCCAEEFWRVYFHLDDWWVDDEINLHNYSKIHVMRKLLLSLWVYFHSLNLQFNGLSPSPRTSPQSHFMIINLSNNTIEAYKEKDSWIH